jgi:hypothetical protein
MIRRVTNALYETELAKLLAVVFVCERSTIEKSPFTLTDSETLGFLPFECWNELRPNPKIGLS